MLTVAPDQPADPARRTSPRRSTALARRVLAVGVGALLAGSVAACGGDGEATPQAGGQGDKADVADLPKATTDATIEEAPRDPRPHGTTEGEVIHPKKELTVHDSANGTPVARLPVEQRSSPTWAPVIARDGDWAHILLPSRPNRASGWVRTSERNVESARNEHRVEVDLSEFSLTVFENDERTDSFTIGHGKPKHPTPTGRSYVIASVVEQQDDYSDIILPLSVHSNTLKTYGGGPGTVGIHTWPDNSFLKQRNSDGCIRVTQGALDRLEKLPLGTIVDIVK